MDATLARLKSGDKSCLDDVLTLVESGVEPLPTGERAQELYTILAHFLVREGAGLVERRVPKNLTLSTDLSRVQYPTPSEHAFLALRILNAIGARGTTDGIEARGALLSVGLRHCRGMTLDAYYNLPRSKRYYVINFLIMLTTIFGCVVSDLLIIPSNIHITERSTIEGAAPPAAPLRAGGANGEDTALHGMGSAPRRTVVPLTSSLEIPARGGGSSASGRGAAAAASSIVSFAPAGTMMAGNSGGIQARSDYNIPINGTSIPIPVPGRRYREMPKRPSSVPYPENPLYDATAALSESTLLLAQFPTPVVLFTKYYGLGCMPRIPLAQVFQTVKQQQKQQPTLSTANNMPNCASTAQVRSRTGEDIRTEGSMAAATGEAVATPGHNARSALAARPSAQVPPNTTSPTSAAANATEVGPSPPEAVRVAMIQRHLQIMGDMARKGAALQKVSESARDSGGVGAARSRDIGSAKTSSRALFSRNGASASNRFSGVTSHPSAPSRSAVFGGGEVDASLLFLDDPSPAAVAYRQRCVTSDLLQRYLDEGRVVSWGCQRCGALGPQRLPRSSDSKSHEGKIRGEGGGSRGRLGISGSITAEECRNPSGTAALASTTIAATTNTASSNDLSTNIAKAVVSSSDVDADQFCFLPLQVRVPEAIVQIACGGLTSYVLSVDGRLYSCGRGDQGQLGIGDKCVKYTATGISRFQRVLLKEDEKIICVASGTATGIALTLDRYVYLWGNNVYGQCMRQPAAARVSAPIRFKTGKYDVLDLACGQQYGALVFSDGVIGTWGSSTMIGGKLMDSALEKTLVEDGSTCVRRVFHIACPTQSDAVLVRAGPHHAMVITRQGEVLTWGTGSGGRLGHSEEEDESKPKVVEALRPYFVVDGSCGHVHTAVLTSTGSVLVFGENTHGQLGLRIGGVAGSGAAASRTQCKSLRSPKQLVLPGKAMAVCCGRESTFILLEDGDLLACGSVRTCGIGLGYGTRIYFPSRILQHSITLSVASGTNHAMATVVNRTTALIRIGHSAIEELSRVESLLVRSGVRCVCVGVGFLIVLSENNGLVALGRGEKGQLGVGDQMKPTQAGEMTVLSTFESIALHRETQLHSIVCGPDFVVAIDGSGRAYGWGSNEHGQLCRSPSAVPCAYSPLKLDAYKGRRVIQFACGGTFVVALSDTWEVLTHGERLYCGLGKESTDSTATPDIVIEPTVVPTLKSIIAIAAGKYHAVAMTSSCAVYAWGKGTLGMGTSSCVAHTPVRVALSQSVRQLGCGPLNSYAINSEGELYVWGSNQHQQCGVPTSTTTITSTSEAEGEREGAKASASTPAAVVTPTLVARQVRDAAFSSCFGVVVHENGAISVAGQLHHAGVDYRLPSFRAQPQPTFLMDINEGKRSHAGDGASRKRRCKNGSNKEADVTAGRDDAGLSTMLSPTTPPPPGISSEAPAPRRRGILKNVSTGTSQSMLHLSQLQSHQQIQPQQNALPQGMIQCVQEFASESDDGGSQYSMLGPLMDGENNGHTPTFGTSDALPHSSSIQSMELMAYNGASQDGGGGGGDKMSNNRHHQGRGITNNGRSASPPSTETPRSASAYSFGATTPAPTPPLRRATSQPSSYSFDITTPPQSPPPSVFSEGLEDLPVPPIRQLEDVLANSKMAPSPIKALSKKASAAKSRNTSGSSSTGYALRCFGGWDQVFAVMEKRRPKREEVKLAAKGLRLLLMGDQE